MDTNAFNPAGGFGQRDLYEVSEHIVKRMMLRTGGRVVEIVFSSEVPPLFVCLNKEWHR